MSAILKKLCDFATIEVRSQTKRISETSGHVDGRQKRTQRTPGNANAFRHALSAIQRRRADGETTDDEQDVRTSILAGLIADKGGEQQIGTAERILAEIISSDVSLLVTVNQAIEGVQKQSESAS